MLGSFALASLALFLSGESQGSPATRAAARIVARIDRIGETLQTTRYRHVTVVRRSEGRYDWDCSGMANWILSRDAPRAFASIGRSRPVAASYWRVIERAPSDAPRNGWQEIADIRDVRPGDVFAWRRPANLWPPSANTGHVGFVMEAPQRVTDERFASVTAFTIRVVDATSLPHGDDTRDPEGEGGFGFGTLLFVTDESGHAHAYGWFGARSRGVIPTDIVFGRPFR